MLLGMGEILEKADLIEDKQARIDFLRKTVNPTMINFLRMGFDKNLKWALPDTDPPYKPCVYLDQESNLYNEIKKLYLFLEGGHPTLKQLKREAMFIQVLESIMPSDAKLLLAVKNKKMPYKWLNKKFMNDVWPGSVA